MKYRAKVTNCISHVMNITRYSNKQLISDGEEDYIIVDSEKEAETIERLNRRMYMAMITYQDLIAITSEKSRLENTGKDHSAENHEMLSEDFELFEKQYMNENESEIISVFDRHAGLVDGAKWQREQMKKVVECL